MAPSPPDGMNEETTPAQAKEDEGTIAERIMRRRRNTAAVVAPDLLQKPTTPFTIHLCSGIQRVGDMAAYLTAGGLRVIHVDYERGGIGHDLARDD
eukprot:1465450-Pleurochrysis_carterae.AAC.1